MVNPKRSLTTSNQGGYFGTRRLDSEGNCSGSRSVAVQGVTGGEPCNGEGRTTVSRRSGENDARPAGSDGQAGADGGYRDYKSRKSAEWQAANAYSTPLVRTGQGSYVRDYDPAPSSKMMARVIVLLVVIAASAAGWILF